MKNRTLIELIKDLKGLVDLKDKDEIKILLSIPNNVVHLMLNFKDNNFNKEILSIYRSSNDFLNEDIYDFVLSKLNNTKNMNKETLIALIGLMKNENFQKSRVYKAVVNYAIKFNDVRFMSNLKLLLDEPVLLNSPYYDFVLSELMNINEHNFYYITLRKIILNEKLINSEVYTDVISLCMNKENEYLIELHKRIENPLFKEMIRHPLFKTLTTKLDISAFYKVTVINEHNLASSKTMKSIYAAFKSFRGKDTMAGFSYLVSPGLNGLLSKNKPQYKEIINISTRIKDDYVFELYNKIIDYTDVLDSNLWKKVLTWVANGQNVENIELFINFLKKNNSFFKSVDSRLIEIIFDSVVSHEDVDWVEHYLEEVSSYVYDGVINSDYRYFKLLLSYVNKIEDSRILYEYFDLFSYGEEQGLYGRVMRNSSFFRTMLEDAVSIKYPNNFGVYKKIIENVDFHAEAQDELVIRISNMFKTQSLPIMNSFFKIIDSSFAKGENYFSIVNAVTEENLEYLPLYSDIISYISFNLISLSNLINNVKEIVLPLFKMTNREKLEKIKRFIIDIRNKQHHIDIKSCKNNLPVFNAQKRDEFLNMIINEKNKYACEIFYSLDVSGYSLKFINELCEVLLSGVDNKDSLGSRLSMLVDSEKIKLEFEKFSLEFLNNSSNIGNIIISRKVEEIYLEELGKLEPQEEATYEECVKILARIK